MLSSFPDGVNDYIRVVRADLNFLGVDNECRHHSDFVLSDHLLVVAVSFNPGHLNTGLHERNFSSPTRSTAVRPEADYFDLASFDQLLNSLLRLLKLLLDDVLTSWADQAEA